MLNFLHQFAITIVKSVTGTGCLGIPFSMVQVVISHSNHAQMGIIPTIIVFFLVTVANIINTRYLIESNEGLKRRQLSMKEGLKIDNDYANLMYQVYTVLELSSQIAFRTPWLLFIPPLLLPYRVGCDVGNDDFNGGLLKSSSFS